MGMIRVGMRSEFLVLILAGPAWPKIQIPLTMAQAADLRAQLGALISDDLLNVEPFSSDSFEEGQ